MASIWQGTGALIDPGTRYVLRITARTGYDNGDWGDGAWMSLSSIDTGVWTDIVPDTSHLFPDGDNSDTVAGKGPWREFTIYFNSAGNPTIVGDEIGLSLRLDDNNARAGWGDYGWIHYDKVELFALRADDPIPANDPDPQDDIDAVGMPGTVGVDVTLEWSTMLDPNDLGEPLSTVTKHYLYFKENDPNVTVGTTPIEVAGGAATASYAMTGLNHNSVYYWRVDESINDSAATDPSTVTGTLWAFETVPESPVITDEPDDVLSGDGTAEFSLGAVSATTMTYAWYTSTDLVQDPLSDTSVGTDANTLSLSGVTDPVYVYCVVDNSLETYSRMALLEVERLAGQWSLNNDLTDASGDGWTGSIADPNFNGDSIEGTASYEFFGDGRVIEITGSEDPFNFYHLGLTVSAWVKSSNTGWTGVVSKQTRDGGDWLGWVLGTNGDSQAYIDIRGAGSATGSTAVLDGQWHLITATYDLATQQLKIYIDGELENTADSVVYTRDMTGEPVVIGAENVAGDTSYTGLVDDAQIDTYALSDKEVLDLYNALIEPDKVLCLNAINEAADIVDDCKINLLDVAELASGWLGCGLYPVTACP